jgi:hypothetical protein
LHQENAMKQPLIHALLLALTLASGASAQAAAEELELEARFRAKIAKEKIRMSAAERDALARGQSQVSAGCGSQSIGNVDTGGRIGAAPREVFVFAPNAINIVGRGGCR